MKILSRNNKQGTIVLQTQSLDDIWLMYRIVQPGDFVSGWTERKIKIGDSINEKASAVTIKKMFLVVAVEKITYEHDGKSVRFLGPIKEGNEFVSAGEYHAMVVDEKTQITIEKRNWPTYMLRQIEEASLGGKGASVIVAFDRSTAMIGSSTIKGFNRLMTIEGAVQKKGIDAKTKETFYEELVTQLVAIDARINPTIIILASSNFWKDSLFKQIDAQARELRKKTKWIECDDVSESAIAQLSLTKEFQQLTMGRSQSDILNSFEEILRRIGTDGTATYGLREVESAAQQSAVSVVLISQHAMYNAREKGNFERLESLLSQIEQASGVVHIVGEETSISAKLDGLGGIAALLRFKV